MLKQQRVQITPHFNAETASILREVNRQGEIFPLTNRYDVEKDAIFINYDQIEMKLIHFPTLNIFQRQAYTKHLCVIAKKLPKDKQLPEVFLDFLKDIGKDCQQIRFELVGQARELFNEPCREDLQLAIVQQLAIILREACFDTRQRLNEVLGFIAPNLCEASRSIFLKQAIKLTNDGVEECKMIGMQLLTKLAGSLGKDYCEEFVVKEMLILGDHTSIRVRKEAVLSLPVLADAIGEKFFQGVLMDFYRRKCEENSWSVRKACVDMIADLAKRTSSIPIKQQLSRIMLRFLKDGQRTVKVNSHKILPMFLGVITLPKNNPCLDLLLDPYLKLIDSDLNQSVGSNDIIKSISYTFPAVLEGLGKERWPKLIPLFTRLLKFTDQEVRAPLAFSLHEIGRLIGPEEAKEHLFPCLDMILKDGSDYLKLGSISHLSQFVSLFSNDIRQNLIDVFLVLQRDPRKWRIRHSIASQIHHLALIYPPQIVFQYIVPIAFKLCSDPVSQVRHVASSNIGSLVDILKDQPNHLFVVVESIKGFAYSGRWNQRQSFIDMLGGLVRFGRVWEQEIVGCMELLAGDRVVAVRVVLAGFVGALDQKIKEQPRMQALIETLRNDPDKDVVQTLLQPPQQTPPPFSQ